VHKPATNHDHPDARRQRWLQEQMSISASGWLRLNGIPLPGLQPEIMRPMKQSVEKAPVVELKDGVHYKLKEVSAATGISVGTIRRAALAGEVKFARTSNGATSPIRIRGRDVRAWLVSAETANKKVLSTRETADLKRRAK
jgi:hypothetical protein